jgi:hypothetical protein
MKLAREETKIKVTGRSFYRKNNLKFKGRNRNRNRSRNCGQKNWDPEPEPRQNGTVPQHCLQDDSFECFSYLDPVSEQLDPALKDN